MSTHTPGPWFRDQYGHIYGTDYPRPDPDFPGATITSHPLVCTPKNSADTSLIAAAPDLLAALQATYDALCISYPLHSSDMDTRYSVMSAARAAIAKATGEQQ